MSDPFIAEIRIFPFNFAPKGWAWCNGQLLPISQNTALFSLLGAFYGGDGKSTFALPDMQGCAPMQTGQGQGLSERVLGETGGSDTVTLLVSEIPVHTHTLRAVSQEVADLNAPGPLTNFARSNNGSAYNPAAAPLGQMAFETVALAGGGLPHNNMMPYLTCNFNIALQGVFPPRG